MKHFFVLLLTAATLVLSACASAPAPSMPVAPNAAQLSAIDVATLPLNVDVATVYALLGRNDVVLLDVREPDEYAAGHIPGVRLMPMGTVPSHLNDIPADKTVIVTCRSGNRSGQITNFLRSNGFTRVHNMQGGILAWRRAGYPVEK